MGCTSAAVNAVSFHLIDTALVPFDLVTLTYDPTQNFLRQGREKYVKAAQTECAKKGMTHWCVGTYSRTPLGPGPLGIRKITEIEGYTAEGTLDALYKGKFAQVQVDYKFYSPSPDHLESIEEYFWAFDPSADLPFVVDIAGREVAFNAHVHRFENLNFEHQDDQNEGVVSIFQVRATVDYPVVVHARNVYPALSIGLKVYCRTGENRDVEVYSAVYE